MKIATYNVWNYHIEVRCDQLLDEIRIVDADIIGLQEVPPFFYDKDLLQKLNYPYHVYGQYSGEEEGLAILSKYPIVESKFLHEHEENGNSNAISTIIKVDEKVITFTNVHLPWDSALQKERQICEIDQDIHSQIDRVGLCVLVGDFNGGLGSSVHRYLVGDQALNGYEANPYWDELATAYQAISGEPIRPTLDVLHNPRWKGRQPAYPPMVMDRIYTLDHQYSISLEGLSVFGTEVSPETHLAASDHYGVVAEIKFDE